MVQSRLLAHQTPHDDAFREIQLNGKQLVFLFMVATVLSVVIFLCGVFVGRGVRAERAPQAADAPAASTPVTTPDVVPEGAAVAAPPAGSDPTTAAPPPAVDELTYFNRLEGKGKTPENLKSPADLAAASQSEKKTSPAAAGRSVARMAAPPTPAPREAPVAKEPPAAKPPAAKEVAVAKAPVPAKEPPAVKEPAPKGEPAVAAVAEPVGSGFALQVTALKERDEAEAVAKRLSAKGYSAYVITPPPNGTPKYYRVRIGKFHTRREAEDIATKLQKEEQIKPWITR